MPAKVTASAVSRPAQFPCKPVQERIRRALPDDDSYSKQFRGPGMDNHFATWLNQACNISCRAGYLDLVNRFLQEDALYVASRQPSCPH